MRGQIIRTAFKHKALHYDSTTHNDILKDCYYLTL